MKFDEDDENTLLYKLNEITKYFDLCYWRARRNGKEYNKNLSNCEWQINKLLIDYFDSIYHLEF